MQALTTKLGFYRRRVAEVGVAGLIARRRRKRLLRRVLGGRAGLEIGGPSPIFRADGDLPAYPFIADLDNVNFGTKTIWEGEIREGRTFAFHPDRPPGRQFVAEATDLAVIADAAYDFLLSSHTLEHSANPLKALAEWRRIVRPGGTLLILLPHKAGTFDHRRPTTTLAHMIADFEDDRGEDDLSHLEEVLELHDPATTPEIGTPAEFRLRSERNLENRCLHHHTFTTSSAVALLDHAGLQMHHVAGLAPFHSLLIATNPPPGRGPDNRRFLDPGARWRRRSQIAQDRESAGA